MNQSQVPIDLTNFRSITNGDKALEKELFLEFISSTEGHIATLEQNCTDGENETWRTAAHAIKGTALNMGAQPLALIAKKGQDSKGALGEEKKKILADIKVQFGLVKDFLIKEM